MKLAIHTVFNLRENILFLEDWITYHKLLGFDLFYLYDNSKSISVDNRTKSTNKYKIDFAKATSHINDLELDEMINRIKDKFEKEITYIIWEPKDSYGNVIYFQEGAIRHYIEHYSDQSDWSAFIDMDEFIFCETDLKGTIDRIKRTENAFNIVLFQKKFDDRFNNLDKSVLDITNCIDDIDTTNWAPKNICYSPILKLFDQYVNWQIHFMLQEHAKSYYCDPKKFRFNHYNVNECQLEWMRGFYQTHDNFFLNGMCSELLDRAKILKRNKSNEQS